jgi:uncharacterized membrane protein YbaN (DUF454 family)
MPTDNAPQKALCSRKRRVVKALLLFAGTICLLLGAVGIVLPIVPTTPFLLLAAACFFRSSDRMYNWLLSNRWFGKYIRNYREGKGIPLKTKILALTILWGAILYSVILVVDEILIAQVAMLAVAVGVTIHLLRLPTCRNNA